MNPNLEQLQPYPFERLAKLKQDVEKTAPYSPIFLSIGEPKHPTPAFIQEALRGVLSDLARYPLTKGGPELRGAIAEWLRRRFSLSTLDLDSQVLPVNGTREALFSFAQSVVECGVEPPPLVLMPNPFYQIYEGAALLAGAEPWFINVGRENDFVPDFSTVPENVWERCQLLYICSPNNPSGAVLSLEELQNLIHLADEYDFIIASDECYSELYIAEDMPPPGLLQAAAALDRHDYRRCVVFHSLSKRSSAPGLRSGFVAGDAEVLARFLLYRTYHGCAQALPVQAAATAAWSEEAHVQENRRLYREKFLAMQEILGSVLNFSMPPAGFYLWPETPLPDEEFTRRLFAEENVTVLPGSYLSRPAHGVNPGENHVRIALVAELEECIEAARRIRRFVERLD